MVTVTEGARTKILELLAHESRQGLGLRFAIDGRGPGGFRYRLGFVGPEERRPDDTVFDAGGFTMYIDAASAPRLQGASIDYVETLQESGFKIENPNAAWADPMARAVQEVIDRDINPAVASHGGYVVLLDVKDDVVYVEMHGGCQGCGMASVTLRQGIEGVLAQYIPEVKAVVDITDHGSGANPYFASAKK